METKDPQKVKISIIDFMPEFRKHSIGSTDVNGKDICYGDTVEHNGQNHFVSYRYGTPCLKQPNTMHTIGLKDWSVVMVTNIFGAAQDYLIIGYDNEPFIQECLKLDLV